ncbi:hypothetical protein NM688_g557 [Phlebia brevispora]|uniref:Uncharacterized protein n=1 Tax=Phlebia brevispora TaxID=194682 RepID=A0ACC1TEC8_9APHY|nr:hypothetical protein NM688_g557 [Phlebia brevispora]
MSTLDRQSSSVPSPQLNEQLFVRLADVQMAGMMKAMINPEIFATARTGTPPIPGGMTDVMKRMKTIIMAQRVLRPEEYRQVPDLLRRMRHLLRVFYDAKISGRRTDEFMYCDYGEIDDMGMDLHRLGLTLQYTPGRLRELFEYAPEMDKFLLDEPIDLGDLRRRAFERKCANTPLSGAGHPTP